MRSVKADFVQLADRSNQRCIGARRYTMALAMGEFGGLLFRMKLIIGRIVP